MAEKNTKRLLSSLNNGNLDDAEDLLNDGADGNLVDDVQAISAMHLAAGLGLKSVCLLLQHGGDPNIKLPDGTTPVHVASMWGDSDCVQILMANGGDPFLRDQDGMSALDLARTYKHASVIQVLEHYMIMFTQSEEHTITPKFTYTRRSLDSNTSQRSSTPDSYGVLNQDIMINSYDDDDNDEAETLYPGGLRLGDYLHQFKERRRSSIYTQSVQRQVDRHFSHGQKTHAVDVTSPDHPYIEPKHRYNDAYLDSTTTGLLDSPDSNHSNQTDQSLHLHLSVSDLENQSCDSFVTCDGEDLDTILQNQKTEDLESDEDDSYDSKVVFNTVIKNTKFMESDNTNHSSNVSTQLFNEGERNRHQLFKNEDMKNHSRGDKYCRRNPLFAPASTQDLLVETNVKCEHCGSLVELGKSDTETVCDKCERLGLELNALDEKQYKPYMPSTKHKDRVLNNIQNKNNNQNNIHSSDTKTKSNFDDLVNKFRRTSLCNDTQSYQLNGNTFEENPPLKINDSLISSDESFFEQRRKAEFHPGDISTISSTLDTVSYQDRAFINTLPDQSNQEIKKSDKTICSKDKQGHNTNTKNSKTTKMTPKNNNKENCADFDDLWSEVRASNKANKRLRERTHVLDTAFVGRGSLCSIVSSTSTVEYVYTDRENGITLVERHIPSQCGSQGSRRSLDSLFSVNISSHNGSPNLDHALVHSSRPSSVNTSQETVLYDWKDDAMINVSDDTGISSCPLSQELQSLDNITVRSRLCDLGDDPGPVTTTTRQAYLTRLSQLEKDPDRKLFTFKRQEYPPEMSLALQGKLDHSDTAELEVKMISSFKNRLRRWREGTLKSSFDYILLDPRVTKDLPNRAVNMSDLDVFATFISAIIYIGKGKRSRPYSHLYEAIKQMKNPKDKPSCKVEKILDIWSCDLGVVSLHCFQSVIPVEAYTREACMLDAMGLNNLTNQKRGDYYGISTTFSMKQKRTMGVYLLGKALQIFLAEGERQIAPLDIKNDA